LKDAPPQFWKAQLIGVHTLWHPTQIEYLDLEMGKKLRSNVYEATLDGTMVVVKFARFSSEISYLEEETVAYHWIEGHKVGPKFLGHLTEEGRVIGFVMEQIVGHRAGPDDLELCRSALKRLHDLGIKHGDVNRHNFIINRGETVIVDFQSAVKCRDYTALQDELAKLSEELEDESGKGGRVVLH
jgi:predicted Ser/Thr protein kinase